MVHILQVTRRLEMAHLFTRQSRRISYAVLVTGLFLGATTPAPANEPASFTSFAVSNYSGDHYLAFGFIEDEVPTECLVVFSGLLWGESRVPDESGYFEVDFMLAQGRSGIVQALLYDPAWLFTDFAQYYVD
jgi:hypothetical protein